MEFEGKEMLTGISVKARIIQQNENMCCA